MQRKLNVGCGQFPKPGYINTDWDPDAAMDARIDLNAPYFSFKDRIMDIIEASHVLEHLDDPFHAMHEFHRILKKRGRLRIRVPHCSRGFVHPEHRRGFDVSFPLYFDKTFKGGYQHVDFTLLSMRLTWFAQRDLKKAYMGRIAFALVTLMSHVIDFLANASPYFCSKIWCYWVGGFDEIEFVFEKA